MKNYMYIFSGLPGTGKSKTSTDLRLKLGYKKCDWLSTDCTRDGYFPTAEMGRLIKYCKEVSGAVYSILFLEAKVSLLRGKDVILDGTFLRELGWHQALNVKAETDSNLIVIQTECSDEEVLHRMTRRDMVDGDTKYKSEADYFIYEKMKKALGEKDYCLPQNSILLRQANIPIIIFNTEAHDARFAGEIHTGYELAVKDLLVNQEEAE